MKILKKIVLILSLITLITLPNVMATENAVEDGETNYNMISVEGKMRFKQFVEIKEGYEKFCILEGILFFIAIFMTVKTTAIDTSTKSGLLIAILGILAYVLRYSVIGNIIFMLDILLQILGTVLVILSCIYIYKNQNILIYAPICLCGMWYIIKNIPMISGNIILKIVLIALPIILYVLGRVTSKAEEIEMLRPVKEKHERK